MFTRFSFSAIASIIISLFLLPGCTGVDSPAVPSELQTPMNEVDCCQERLNLGVWQFRIDPDNETVDIIPLRTVESHMNGLAFMEPPAGVNLAIDQIVDLSAGELTVDIKITHPYDGMDKFAAFDICGILISHGTMDFPLYDQLKWAGADVVHLKNPDGYTRWWNPHEFPSVPGAPQDGYIDGLLGTSNTTGLYDATLNGYKYFATDLIDPEADLSGLDLLKRGVLEPGTSCTRRYVIGFTPGNLVFNYAVDANWHPPTPSGPGGEVIIPDDFPASANRTEPYRIEIVDIDNTLEWDSDSETATGMLYFSVIVYDWFNADSNMLCPYAQNEEVMGFCNPTPSEVGDGYARYDLEAMPLMFDGPGSFMMWISVDSEEYGYQEHLPFESNSVYFQTWFDIN